MLSRIDAKEFFFAGHIKKKRYREKSRMLRHRHQQHTGFLIWRDSVINIHTWLWNKYSRSPFVPRVNHSFLSSYFRRNSEEKNGDRETCWFKREIPSLILFGVSLLCSLFWFRSLNLDVVSSRVKNLCNQLFSLYRISLKIDDVFVCLVLLYSMIFLMLDLRQSFFISRPLHHILLCASLRFFTLDKQNLSSICSFIVLMFLSFFSVSSIVFSLDPLITFLVILFS